MTPTIGQKLKLAPEFETDKHGSGRNASKPKTHLCTVISVNKAHRHFRVRFEMPNGSFTESFKFV